MKNILLVGCGNLGRAMLGRWLEIPDLHFTLLVRSPNLPLLDLIEPYADRVIVNPTVQFKADVAVLAVKPQQMDDAILPLTHGLPAETLVISVAAGKRIAYYEQHLQPGQPVIRAIPNMAASVGESMTVCVANKNVNDKHRELAKPLLDSIGRTVWWENDETLSNVTAVSGSGPAYVFLLAECLAKAAEAGGLAPEAAEMLARQTVIGAGQQLKNSGLSPEELRQQVTSPGGTTEAALKILTGKGGMCEMLAEAIKAAIARSKQMAN